ncbi:MAG: SRPBCC domain-containing protein [Deltaproteobacteria bacterium]|nr:SRPBCC domain-containing protein [Deltaproteobacteria bacterium]
MNDIKKTEAASDSEFVITRLIDAPRERVWKAWTDEEQLKAWFGPKGSESIHARLDLRPSGIYHYGMRYAGVEVWGKWTLREIVAPERLVFISAFSDKEGGLGRHPLAPTWPQQMLSTVLFTDVGGKTLITLKWSAFEATEAEAKTFRDGFDSMRQGWGGTFERLDAHLKEGTSTGEG